MESSVADFTVLSVSLFGDRRLENCLSELPQKEFGFLAESDSECQTALLFAALKNLVALAWVPVTFSKAF